MLNKASEPGIQNPKSSTVLGGNRIHFVIYRNRSEFNNQRIEPRGKVFYSPSKELEVFYSPSKELEGKYCQDMVESSKILTEEEKPATVCCPSSFQEFGEIFLECVLGLPRQR